MLKLKEYRVESKNLWKISYPTMISIALQSIYDIVDIAWVGQISKEATAAITIYSVIFWLFAVTNDIIASSSVSMLSQAYGKNDYKRYRYISEQNFGFKFLMGILTGLILLLIQKPLMMFFLNDSFSTNLAMKYGVARTVFMPALFLSYSINTIIRATGDSKTPMKIMVVSTLMNLILDPIFMFDKFNILGMNFSGFGMGIFGAALATNISIMTTIVLGIIHLKKLPRYLAPEYKNIFKINWDIALDFLKIGLPSGIEGLFRNFSMAVLMKFITAYGTVAVSAAGIGSKLFAIAFMPVYGFLMGGSTLIGQYLGKDDVEKAQLVAKASSYNSVAFLSLLVGFTFMFPRYLMGTFIKDAEVIELGVSMIRIVGPALIISAFIFGRAVVFIGSGYNKPLLVASIVARWGVQVPALFLFVNILELEINAIWFTFIMAEVADFVILYYYYRLGKWKKMRV